MRNLKRALSLALASVMLLGMMVVGASAASYTDVDDKDNVEAIEVLNAVNVMIGRQGNFEPDEAVNRHEMAVIMAKLVLGVETADNYVGSHPFTDVVPWADKYVAACYENGLVAGTSATTFSGSKNLTAVEAAAMMLRALGYEDLSKGATDWRAPVTAAANRIRLFDGVASNPSEKLNRNQVAQLTLNTLKSYMVDTNQGLNITGSNGDYTFTVNGDREYIARSSLDAYATAISDVEQRGTSASSIGGYTVELGEHLYNGKLRLNNSDLDVFGRPARTWEYDGKEIGTYMKDELLRKTYTTKVTGKDLYDLLTKNTIDTYDFIITVDGVERNDANAKTMLAKASTGMANAWFDEDDMFRANDNAVGGTGKGVLTQVYVDSNNKMVYISVVNTYLAKAAENYDEKDEDVILNVHKLDDKGSSSRPVYVKTNTNTPEPITVSNEDFDVTGVKKDDFFLVTVADGAIQSMEKPEVIDKTVISSFSVGSWVNNGTKYEYATTAKYNHEVLDDYDVKNMKNLTYNIFLDEYGYLIGLERNEDPDEYVFLTGINTGWSNIAVKTAEANVIHMDGRLASVDVNMADSYIPSAGTTTTKNLGQVNTWCKYTVDTKGVYTLTEVKTSTTQNETKVAVNPVKVAQYAQDVAIYKDAGAATKTISQRYWSLNAADGSSYVYGNENSVYINVSLKDVRVSDGTHGGPNCRIINEVDAVVTDVAKANVVVKDLGAGYTGSYTNPAAEIYTLYNDKNIVIAAVTIGEDDGSNVRYVSPVKSNVEEEDYGHGSGTRAVDGKWTWHRKVVTLDGTVETITETGDKLKCIGAYDASTTPATGMQQGVWYEIRLNADGDVRRREAVNFATANDKFASSLEDANDQAPKYDTVIMYDNGGAGTYNGTAYGAITGLKLEKNGMLYAERGVATQNTRRGIYIDEDTKVVLVTAKDATGDMKNQWTGTGRTGLEQALSKMNSESGSFDVELSAVIKMGKTTVVVINDQTPVSAAANPNPKPSQGIAGAKVAVKGADGGANLAIGYFGIAKPGTIAELNAIIGDWAINEKGYTAVSNPEQNPAGTGYKWTCTNSYGLDTTYTLLVADIKEGVRVRYVDDLGAVKNVGYEIVSGTRAANDISTGDEHAAYAVKDSNGDSKADVVWIKNYKTESSAEGRYIAVRANSSAAWTWSAAPSAAAAAPAVVTDAGVVSIDGHDYDVRLSTAKTKTTIVDRANANNTKVYYTASTKLLDDSDAAGVFHDLAALVADGFAGAGTVAKKTTGGSATSYVALADDLATADGDTFEVGYVKISKELESGKGTITAKAGGTTYAISTHQVDSSANIAIPANSSVEVTAAKGNALSYRANDAAKTEFTTTSGADAVKTIQTGDTDITFGKLETLSVTITNPDTTNVTITVTYNNREYANGGSIVAAAGDKIYATVTVNGAKSGIAKDTVAAAISGSKVLYKSFDPALGTLGASGASPFTFNDPVSFTGTKTIEIEFTVTAGDSAVSVVYAENS